MEQFSHAVYYYKYKDRIFGIIPSMDKFFSVKNEREFPKYILSESKPLFHESFIRKTRIKRVFVLTNACNLQCSYCFEGEHNASINMNPDDIVLGVENMFHEAQVLGKKIISLSLFGGEPSMNWEAIVETVRIVKKLEEENRIRCYKAIVTNGAMKSTQALYLAANFDYVYFSFDGPKELFLQQRKPKAGDYLYDLIFNNAKLVYKYGAYLSFKITVTKLTIDYLKQIDDFFADEFPTCSRLYQPCMVNEDDSLYIYFGNFLEKYLELQRYSLFKKNMTTPLYKNHPSDRFCNLSIRNVQYPNGTVLACHRSNMCIGDDKIKENFYVGICKNGKICKDKEKVENIKKFTVDNINECSKCPLKYHCCGGCATIKLLSGNGDMFRKADYCEDLKKYSFTLMLSRLFDNQIDYLKTLPEKNIVSNGTIKQSIFENTIVEKILSIEE